MGESCRYCGSAAGLHTADELAHHARLLAELGPLPADERRLVRRHEVLARFGLHG